MYLHSIIWIIIIVFKQHSQEFARTTKYHLLFMIFTIWSCCFLCWLCHLALQSTSFSTLLSTWKAHLWGATRPGSLILSSAGDQVMEETGWRREVRRWQWWLPHSQTLSERLPWKFGCNPGQKVIAPLKHPGFFITLSFHIQRPLLPFCYPCRPQSSEPIAQDHILPTTPLHTIISLYSLLSFLNCPNLNVPKLNFPLKNNWSQLF